MQDLGNKAKLELREAINSLSMALDMVEESEKLWFYFRSF